MLRERWTRMAFLAVRIGAVLLLAATVISLRSPRVSAGTLGWDTTTAVVPGGTLTINETVPDVNIANSTNINTCPITGLGTDFITYTCDPAGPGIPAGTHLLQSWSSPGGQALQGPFSEKVTYNANGGIVAQAGPTPCATTAGSEDSYTQDWSCTINVLPVQYPESLTVYLLASDRSLVMFGEQGMTLLYFIFH